jgi:hypothetical protein
VVLEEELQVHVVVKRRLRQLDEYVDIAIRVGSAPGEGAKQGDAQH